MNRSIARMPALSTAGFRPACMSARVNPARLTWSRSGRLSRTALNPASNAATASASSCATARWPASSSASATGKAGAAGDARAGTTSPPAPARQSRSAARLSSRRWRARTGSSAGSGATLALRCCNGACGKGSAAGNPWHSREGTLPTSRLVSHLTSVNRSPGAGYAGPLGRAAAQVTSMKNHLLK